MAVIPGNVEHEGFFPEDTEVVDVFSPPREDFLTGQPPSYMAVQNSTLPGAGMSWSEKLHLKLRICLCTLAANLNTL